MPMNERIICAAIWFKDEIYHVHQPKNIESGLVITGFRHCNCIYIRSKTSIPRLTNSIQGFLTSKNRFVCRQKAWIIAKNAKQMKTNRAFLPNNKLDSSNLY